MMCQHCENAPCETVCPVNATVHSEDGLNVMAYNRCIGTRYCANNCPFKVRRFNFFDYNQRPIGKEENRRRVHRLPGISRAAHEEGRARHDEAAEESERHRAHARRDGEMHLLRAAHRGGEDRRARARGRVEQHAAFRAIRSPRACAQACPTEAIVFGDITDPESRVSKMKAAGPQLPAARIFECEHAHELSGADSQSESENA